MNRISVLSDFDRMFRGFDRIARTTFPAPRIRVGRVDGPVPAIESYTSENEVVLRAELPGVSRDDVQIEVEDNRLTIRGEKKVEEAKEGTDYHVREVRYGKFERSFVLPEGVDADQVRAHMENGLLEIRLPLAEKPSARRIEISNGAPKEEAIA